MCREVKNACYVIFLPPCVIRVSRQLNGKHFMLCHSIHKMKIYSQQRQNGPEPLHCAYIWWYVSTAGSLSMTKHRIHLVMGNCSAVCTDPKWPFHATVSPKIRSVPLYKAGTVAKVLCYKSEGRWFDPSRCHWKFYWHKILPIALWLWGRLSL